MWTSPTVPGGHFLPSVVTHPNLQPKDCPAAVPGLAAAVDVVEGAERGGLGEPLPFEDGAAEAGLESPGDLPGKRRAAGDGDTEPGEVRRVRITRRVSTAFHMVGTPAMMVSRSRRSMSSIDAGSNRAGNDIEPPTAKVAIMTDAWPNTWNGIKSSGGVAG